MLEAAASREKTRNTFLMGTRILVQTAEVDGSLWACANGKMWVVSDKVTKFGEEDGAKGEKG